MGLTGWSWSSPTLNLIVMLPPPPPPPLAKSSWLVLAVSPQVGPSLVWAKFYLANLLTNTVITALICSSAQPGGRWEVGELSNDWLCVAHIIIISNTGGNTGGNTANTAHHNGQSTQKMPVSVLFSSLLTYLRHNLTTRYMEGIREDTAGKKIILPLCCVEHLGRYDKSQCLIFVKPRDCCSK